MIRLIVVCVLALIAHDVRAQSESDLRVRGMIRSLGEATISSELSARIIAMPSREGNMFKAGDVLVTFDCARAEAELESLSADLIAAKTTHEGNQELLNHKAIGAREIALSASRVTKAQADVDAGRARLAGCRIVAPFDGVVVETMANPSEIANPSSPLLRIVDTNRLEIELIGSSRLLRRDLVGLEFGFTLDDTAVTYRARLVRQGGVVDPVSQTVKFFGLLIDQDSRVRPGMSGTAKFPPEAL